MRTRTCKFRWPRGKWKDRAARSLTLHTVRANYTRTCRRGRALIARGTTCGGGKVFQRRWARREKGKGNKEKRQPKAAIWISGARRQRWSAKQVARKWIYRARAGAADRQGRAPHYYVYVQCAHWCVRIRMCVDRDGKCASTRARKAADW